MKTKLEIIFVAVGACAALVAGCGTRSGEGTVRPVDWYEKNAAEREAKLAECRANPGLLDGTPDCINASRAANNANAEAKWATEKEGVRTEPSIPPP
ncbi:MAG: EexN family lipoprotein [Nitrosospira sp.]|nr:EexN family lipoprotein [Nitrosospira sp.]